MHQTNYWQQKEKTVVNQQQITGLVTKNMIRIELSHSILSCLVNGGNKWHSNKIVVVYAYTDFICCLLCCTLFLSLQNLICFYFMLAQYFTHEMLAQY